MGTVPIRAGATFAVKCKSGFPDVQVRSLVLLIKLLLLLNLFDGEGETRWNEGLAGRLWVVVLRGRWRRLKEILIHLIIRIDL